MSELTQEEQAAEALRERVRQRIQVEKDKGEVFRRQAQIMLGALSDIAALPEGERFKGPVIARSAIARAKGARDGSSNSDATDPGAVGAGSTLA